MGVRARRRVITRFIFVGCFRPSADNGDCRTEAVAAARCSHELEGLADERNSEIGLASREEPRVAEKDAGDEIQIVFAMALSVNNCCREIAPVQIQAADKSQAPKGSQNGLCDKSDRSCRCGQRWVSCANNIASLETDAQMLVFDSG